MFAALKYRWCLWQVASRNPARRAAAVEALGKLRDKRAFEPLSAAVRDADADVRRQAVAALAALGDARVLPFFLDNLGSCGTDVRPAVVHALGESGDPRAVDAIRGLLIDRDAHSGSMARFL